MMEVLLDILQTEARELYFIDDAKKPFLILCDGVGVTGKGNHFAVYFADIQSWQFNKASDAKKKVDFFVYQALKKGKQIYIQRRFYKKKRYYGR